MKYILSVISIIAILSYTGKDNIPQANISNGIVSATLYLPDVEKGYYRSTRFDWSGQISDLKYKDRTYFGKFFEKYDPYIHDAIMGPVEAFDPVGYNDAPVGGSFVKIGIGVMEKPEVQEYQYFRTYKVTNYGKWKTKKSQDKITFIHTLNDPASSYVYTKTVQLTKGKPEMIISHTLKNTGTKAIETNVYNHNFFVLDNQITGPDFEVKFPFDLSIEQSNERKAATISGKQILLEGYQAGNNYYLGPITGFSSDANDYNITLKNKKTGTGVNITSDRPLSRLAFWAGPKTVCPEPYVMVKAAPGEEFSWKTIYTFHADEPGTQQ